MIKLMPRDRAKPPVTARLGELSPVEFRWLLQTVRIEQERRRAQKAVRE